MNRWANIEVLSAKDDVLPFEPRSCGQGRCRVRDVPDGENMSRFVRLGIEGWRERERIH